MCRDGDAGLERGYVVTEGNHAGTRLIAIEEFDTRADLDSFTVSQPLDDEVQATIAATFTHIGPFTVVDMVVVDEFAAG